MDRLPNWMRWALMVPAAAGCFLLAFPLTRLAYAVFTYMSPYKPSEWFVDFVAYLLVGVSFVGVPASIAPKKQKTVAIVFACAYACFAALAITAQMVTGNESGNTWWEVAGIVVAGGLGAIAACKFIFDENKEVID